MYPIAAGIIEKGSQEVVDVRLAIFHMGMESLEIHQTMAMVGVWQRYDGAQSEAALLMALVLMMS